MRSISHTCSCFAAIAALIAAAAAGQPSPTPPATSPPSGATEPAAADLANGERLFTDNCEICHGADGMGGQGGGVPLDRVADVMAAMQTLDAGRNSMPSFNGILTPAQMRDVATYVVQRLGAQRPDH